VPYSNTRAQMWQSGLLTAKKLGEHKNASALSESIIKISDISLKASRFALGRSGVQISSSAPLMILRSKFFVMLSLFQFLTVFGSYLSVKLRD
jgi:hypothetical protein